MICAATANPDGVAWTQYVSQGVSYDVYTRLLTMLIVFWRLFLREYFVVEFGWQICLE